MGFVSGFTGGVTVTLSLAYLAAITHRRNREHQSSIVRSQALALQELVDPPPEPLYPVRAEIATRDATYVEVAKDRWNQEVLSAVRWAQSTDWAEVREGLEETTANVLAKLFGTSPEASVREAKERQVKPVDPRAKGQVEESVRGAANAAHGAFERARQAEKQAAATAEDQALQVRLMGRKELSQARQSVEEVGKVAEGTIASALERGKDKVTELVGQAKSAVVTAQGKVDKAVDLSSAPTMGPVEKALNQRYEKHEPLGNRTAAEVLNERYKPIDQRDNTMLRGL